MPEIVSPPTAAISLTPSLGSSCVATLVANPPRNQTSYSLWVFALNFFLILQQSRANEFLCRIAARFENYIYFFCRCFFVRVKMAWESLMAKNNTMDRVPKFRWLFKNRDGIMFVAKYETFQFDSDEPSIAAILSLGHKCYESFPTSDTSW